MTISPSFANRVRRTNLIYIDVLVSTRIRELRRHEVTLAVMDGALRHVGMVAATVPDLWRVEVDTASRRVDVVFLGYRKEPAYSVASVDDLPDPIRRKVSALCMVDPIDSSYVSGVGLRISDSVFWVEDGDG